jgi:hypothetical protein
MQGYGGVISFNLDGDTVSASRFINNMQTAFITPSLGGVETLITQPATTSHYHLDPQTRKRAGISDELIRLSVGLEDVAISSQIWTMPSLQFKNLNRSITSLYTSSDYGCLRRWMNST